MQKGEFMESQSIIQQLSAIPIGTYIAWITVLASIIGVVSTGTIKLYKVFEKAHETKEENEEFRKLVKGHEEEIKAIKEILLNIQNKLDENDRLELKNLRHNIVRAAEEYIANGKITIRQLKALEELFEEYHKRNGNSYVSTLMQKVRLLPVIGELDEDGNDIL